MYILRSGRVLAFAGFARKIEACNGASGQGCHPFVTRHPPAEGPNPFKRVEIFLTRGLVRVEIFHPSGWSGLPEFFLFSTLFVS